MIFYFKFLIVFILLELRFYESFKNKSAMEPYVIGGDYTRISKFPHSVYLSAFCDDYWICGASILNQKILLTAAHCVTDCGSGLRLTAFAGHENLEKVTIVIKVKRAIHHEDYNENVVVNDIAMAFLRDTLPLGRHIKKIILTRNFPFNERNAQVAGWGIINAFTAEESIILKAVKQKVRSKYTCSKLGQLAPGQMCAGSTEASDSRPAEGDSGSALITNDYVQLGIVSFRIDKYPALLVYTNVTFYYNWIRKKSKLLFCKYHRIL